MKLNILTEWFLLSTRFIYARVLSENGHMLNELDSYLLEDSKLVNRRPLVGFDNSKDNLYSLFFGHVGDLVN